MWGHQLHQGPLFKTQLVVRAREDAERGPAEAAGDKPSGSPGAWPLGSRAAEGGRSAGPEPRFYRPHPGHEGPCSPPGTGDSWPCFPGRPAGGCPRTTAPGRPGQQRLAAAVGPELRVQPASWGGGRQAPGERALAQGSAGPLRTGCGRPARVRDDLQHSVPTAGPRDALWPEHGSGRVRSRRAGTAPSPSCGSRARSPGRPRCTLTARFPANLSPQNIPTGRARPKPHVSGPRAPGADATLGSGPGSHPPPAR